MNNEDNMMQKLICLSCITILSISNQINKGCSVGAYSMRENYLREWGCKRRRLIVFCHFEIKILSILNNMNNVFDEMLVDAPWHPLCSWFYCLAAARMSPINLWAQKSLNRAKHKSLSVNSYNFVAHPPQIDQNIKLKNIR